MSHRRRLAALYVLEEHTPRVHMKFKKLSPDAKFFVKSSSFYHFIKAE